MIAPQIKHTIFTWLEEECIEMEDATTAEDQADALWDMYGIICAGLGLLTNNELVLSHKEYLRSQAERHRDGDWWQSFALWLLRTLLQRTEQVRQQRSLEMFETKLKSILAKEVLDED
jgi:hypothetical protein